MLIYIVTSLSRLIWSCCRLPCLVALDSLSLAQSHEWGDPYWILFIRLRYLWRRPCSCRLPWNSIHCRSVQNTVRWGWMCVVGWLLARSDYFISQASQRQLIVFNYSELLITHTPPVYSLLRTDDKLKLWGANVAKSVFIVEFREYRCGIQLLRTLCLTWLESRVDKHCH